MAPKQKKIAAEMTNAELVKEIEKIANHDQLAHVLNSLRTSELTRRIPGARDGNAELRRHNEDLQKQLDQLRDAYRDLEDKGVNLHRELRVLRYE